MSLPSLGVIYPMLFKLSLKNIKKSIKDYAIYFFTLILGVAIFYVFNAIESQTVMLQVSKSTHELIKGNDSRKEFFDKIIDVVTLLGGNLNDAL